MAKRQGFLHKNHLLQKIKSLEDADPELQGIRNSTYFARKFNTPSLATASDSPLPLHSLSVCFLHFSADVGGNMGLFLGCSLLTLCEFVDLIVIMCLRCWRKRNAVETKNDQFK